MHCIVYILPDISIDISIDKLIANSLLLYIYIHFILFILYINDLPNISDTFKSVLFADDTTLIFSNTSILELKNNIQFNINKLYDWLNVNKLSLNISKTNVLLFNIRNKNRNINMDLNINNINVKQVSEIKFLGVIIDCKLNWKLQLN